MVTLELGSFFVSLCAPEFYLPKERKIDPVAATVGEHRSFTIYKVSGWKVMEHNFLGHFADNFLQQWNI